jgi:hypothetical protein
MCRRLPSVSVIFWNSPYAIMALNIDILTHSHKVIASKNREKKKQIKEVLFDEDARRLVSISWPIQKTILFTNIFQRISYWISQTKTCKDRSCKETCDRKGEKRAFGIATRGKCASYLSLFFINRFLATSHVEREGYPKCRRSRKSLWFVTVSFNYINSGLYTLNHRGR